MIHIRSYKSTDYDAIVAVFVNNISTFFDPKEQADLEAYLKTKPEQYFVLEDSEAIIGGAGIRLSDEERIGHITWIFFEPERQGRGLGKQLVNHCLGLLYQSPSLEKIEVTTSQLAYRFFERFGFVVVETQADYWGEGLDLYRMEKRLLPYSTKKR